MKMKQLQKGFTLVEILIYTAIFTLLLFVVVQTLVSFVETQGELRSLRRVENSAVVFLDRISREIREAESVNVSGSTLGTHPGKLSITKDSYTYLFEISNGVMNLSINSVDQGPLTESEASIDSFIVNQFSNGSEEIVQMRLTLSSGQGKYNVTKDFNLSVGLENND